MFKQAVVLLTLFCSFGAWADPAQPTLSQVIRSPQAPKLPIAKLAEFSPEGGQVLGGPFVLKDGRVVAVFSTLSAGPAIEVVDPAGSARVRNVLPRFEGSFCAWFPKVEFDAKDDRLLVLACDQLYDINAIDGKVRSQTDLSKATPGTSLELDDRPDANSLEPAFRITEDGTVVARMKRLNWSEPRWLLLSRKDGTVSGLPLEQQYSNESLVMSGNRVAVASKCRNSESCVVVYSTSGTRLAEYETSGSTFAETPSSWLAIGSYIGKRISEWGGPMGRSEAARVIDQVPMLSQIAVFGDGSLVYSVNAAPDFVGARLEFFDSSWRPRKTVPMNGVWSFHKLLNGMIAVQGVFEGVAIYDSSGQLQGTLPRGAIPAFADPGDVFFEALRQDPHNPNRLLLIGYEGYSRTPLVLEARLPIR